MSSSTFHQRRQLSRLNVGQSGFTLVELLVVIAIIGILVGLLLVAGRGAVIRSQEFAVSTEITQMGQAVEQFRIKYGFYPPSRIPGANDAEKIVAVKRILARIAPNHQHRDADLLTWLMMTGNQIDERNALFFWLGGGIQQNKQFPLGTGGDLETFYEFDSNRLLGTPPGSGGYEMEFGRSTGDRVFLYFGSSSYGDFASATVDDLKPYTLNGVTINPNTFQIYSAGLDADFGSTSSSGSGSGGDVASQGIKASDNLTNFGGGGRLEVFVADN